MSEEEQEVWKTYPDYPFIEASNFGRVRIKDRMTVRSNGAKYHTKGRILKQYDNGHGYMSVKFSMNGKIIHLYVHRIIAICFIPNPDNLPEVNHIDNDPTNNIVSNLEWCTSKYNHDYKKNFGTLPSQVSGHPTIAINTETFEVFRFKTQAEAARNLDASAGNVSSVIKGLYDKTKGFWFCIADENAVEKTREKFGDEIAKKVKRLMSEA